MPIRTIVWGENIHEQINETVRSIYPEGMHNTIAGALNEDGAIEATTATLQEPEHGLLTERSPKRTYWSGGATRIMAGSCDDVVELRGAACVRGNGPDCASFGSFLQNLQALDEHALRTQMA